MNIDDLQKRFDDLITLLRVYVVQVQEIDARRLALENSGHVSIQREKRLNDRELILAQREKEVASEKKYVDEQAKNTQVVLTKIVTEKASLKDLIIQKEELDKERTQLEEERKHVLVATAEKEAFYAEKAAFERERQLFSREKLAQAESQKLLSQREENIRTREEKLDRIERMTAI